MTNFTLIETQARAHAADLLRQGAEARRLRALRPSLRRRLAAAAHALGNRLEAPAGSRPDTAAA